MGDLRCVGLPSLGHGFSTARFLPAVCVVVRCLDPRHFIGLNHSRNYMHTMVSVLRDVYKQRMMVSGV